MSRVGLRRPLRGWALGLVLAIVGLQALRVGVLTSRFSWQVAALVTVGLGLTFGSIPVLAVVKARRQGARAPVGHLWMFSTCVVLTGVLGGRLVGGSVLALRHYPSIAGAAGYHTFRGPHAKVLAVGRPWGHPCQPIRLTVEQSVSDLIYDQVAAVVAEARRAGINVTLETRDFRWAPQSLYYPPGDTSASAVRLGVYAHALPTVRGRKLKHYFLGWDAVVDRDGRHERLTEAKVVVNPRAAQEGPVRIRSDIRAFVALTQGLISSSSPNSAFGTGDVPDGFSERDVAAMRIMSGCGGSAAAVTAVG